MKWEIKHLNELLKFGNGRSRPKEFGNIRVYGGNRVLNYTNRANYTNETIIIGRVGAYCGATYYENQDIWI